MVLVSVVVQISEAEDPCGRFGIRDNVFYKCLIRLPPTLPVLKNEKEGTRIALSCCFSGPANREEK